MTEYWSKMPSFIEFWVNVGINNKPVDFNSTEFSK